MQRSFPFSNQSLYPNLRNEVGYDTRIHGKPTSFNAFSSGLSEREDLIEKLIIIRRDGTTPERRHTSHDLAEMFYERKRLTERRPCLEEGIQLFVDRH